MLARVRTRKQQLSVIDPSNMSHCKSTLSRDIRLMMRHNSSVLMKHAEHMRKGKRGGTIMRVTGVECTLLILGKAQIGEISNAKRDLAIEELRLR